MAISSEPVIRAFQFDDDFVGTMKKGVNLYRGQMTLPLPLLRLPGRNGLSVDIEALYHSVTRDAATTWNMSAPTGVVGLGWELPIERIIRETVGVAEPASTRYWLSAGGQTMLLVPTGRENEYATNDYQFWRVVHEPEEQRWTVTRENGDVYQYGGASIGDSRFVELGVRWGAWTGSSVIPGAQVYPVAFDLRSITNTFGDSVSFEYEQDLVPIGPSGPSYTASARLSRVVDTFGRRVDLSYAPKTEDATAREVQPAHVGSPKGPLYAYQERLETRYLTGLTVRDDAGAELFRVVVRSALHDFSGTGAPTLVKRCLEGVFVQYPGAAPEPGIDFTYHPAGHVAPGALASVRYPSGGVAEIGYAEVGLENAPLVVTLPPRAGTPRVWFGLDYVVFTFQEGETLAVAVYRWTGGWTEVPIATLAARGPIEDLRVITQDGYFVIYYVASSADAAPSARVFVKDPYRPDAYRSFAVDRPVARVVAGADRLLCQVAGTPDLLLYRVTAGALRFESSFRLRSADVALGASGGVFATFTREGQGGVVGLLAESQAGSYVLQTVATIDDVLWEAWVPDSFWSMGESFAAATYVANDRRSYSVSVLRWTSGTDHPIFEALGASPVPEHGLSPAAVHANMIAAAPRLYRFDGASFVTTDLRTTSAEARFAFGVDVALEATSTGGRTEVALATYDAYRTSFGPLLPWGTAPSGEDGPAPPTVGVDYLTIGNAIYFRGATSDWKRIEGARLGDSVNLATVENRAPAFLISEDRAGQSTNLVLLENGSFVAQGGRPFQEITGQRCHVPKGGRGTSLAGPGAFVTYDAGADFESGVGLTLYRVIDASLDVDAVVATATVVKRITFSNGDEAVETRYDYDEIPDGEGRPPIAKGATYDVSGRVPELSKARASDGVPRGAPPGAAPFGTTVKTFLNGVAPAARSTFYPPNDAFSNARSYPSLMNGILVAEESLSASGDPVSLSYSSFWVTARRVGADEVTYLRQRRSIEGSSTTRLGEVPASRRDVAALDGGRVPEDVSRVIAEAGMALGADTTVVALDPGLSFLILDDTNDRLFPVRASADGATLRVFASLRSTVETEHGADNGMVRAQRTRSFDAGGRAMEVSIRSIYLCDVWPEVAARYHMMSQGVQTTTSARGPSGEEVTTASSVTLYWPWGRVASGGYEPLPTPDGEGPWAPWKTFVLAAPRATTEAPPDFDAWATGEPKAPWRRQLTISRRSAHGSPLEKTSLDGVVASYVYDTREMAAVARFANASVALGEASYYDFEPYEENPGWTVGGEAPAPYTGDAHTGTCCHRLSGVAELQSTFHPARAQAYVFSCWVKTDRGSPAPGAAWQFTREGDGRPVADALPIPDTHGEWQSISRVIDLAADLDRPGRAPRIRVSASAGGGAALVDNLRLSPLRGAFTASAIDPRTGAVTATLGSRGETIRSVIDYRGVAVGTSGPEAQGGFTSGYSFRSADDVPNPVKPSSALTVAARTRALYAPFRADTWQDVWFTEDPSAWQIVGSALVSRGAGSKLTSKEALPEGAFALRMQVTPPSTLEGTITIALDGARLLLSPGGASGVWSLVDASGALTLSSPNPRSGVVEWAVVASGRAIVLFVAGARVLSAVLEQPVSGPLSISVDQAGLALEDLLVTVDPLVTMDFQTTFGQVTQSHVLDGERSIVREVIHGPLGWPVVSTKPAAVVSTEDRPPLAYRDGFAVMDPETGTMSGEVAWYYSAENPEAPSDDEGYPFSRQRYEASPDKRVIEAGLPGALHAMGSGHTTRVSYGVNMVDDVSRRLGLPAGQYAVEQRVDPDGIPTFRVTDKTGALIASGTILAHGEPSISAMGYSPAGDLIAGRAPASFDPPDGESPAIFEEHQTYDMLHGLVGMTSSDALTTEYIRDPAGRLRFAQDPRGREEGYYAYTTYDELRRVIESGVIHGPWDRATLERLAGNLPLISGEPDWPTPDLTEGTWSKRLAYDGSGEEPNMIGNLWRAEASNRDAGGAPVVETFAYDAAGHVTRVTVLSGGETESLAYTYDAGGNVVRVTDGGLLDVTYRFDATNTLVGVGEPGAPDRYASYRHYPGGLVAEEALDAGRVRLPFSYDSLGRPTQIGGAESPMVEALGYERRAGGGEGYWNGRIASATYRFEAPGAPEGGGYEYRYDDLGRLVSATSTEPRASLSGLRYDANGNLLELDAGGAATRYAYRGNVVTRVTGEGGAWEIGYDANGAVTSSSAKGLTLSYDRATAYPASARASGGAEVAYRFDALDMPSGERSSRDGLVTERRFLAGASGGTLVETVSAAGATREKIAYIHGPTGLLATKSDATRFVVRDHLGSSRLLLEGGTGVVLAAWDYLPFGGLGRSYGEDRGRLPYLFTGQRWDEEARLYAFGPRMYDPELRRFYARDPARQYASPYVYVGNDPISLVDPTGMMSVAGIFERVGAMAIGALALAAGVGLQIVVDVATLGAAAPFASMAFGGLIGMGVQTMAYTAFNWSDFSWKEYGIQAGIGAAVGVASAGFGVAGSVAANAIKGSAAVVGAIGQSGAAALATAAEVGIGVAGGGLSGAMAQGFQDVSEGKTGSADVGLAFAWGAVGGAVGWGVGRAANGIADKLPIAGAGAADDVSRPLTKGWILARAGAGAAASGLGAGAIQIVANVSQGETWDKNLALAVSTGAALGAIGALPQRSGIRYQPFDDSEELGTAYIGLRRANDGTGA